MFLSILFSLLVPIMALATSPSVPSPNLNPTDLFVLHMEHTRMLHVAKIKPLPEGLVAYFFAHAIPFMELEKINPRQLEEGLRKWNTGIHLLALDKKFVSAPVDGRPLCPIPMFAGGGRERWIFLSGSGPAAAEQHRRKFEIESTEQNLKNLETVGMLSLCEGA